MSEAYPEVTAVYSCGAPILSETVYHRGELTVCIDLPVGYVDLGVKFSCQSHEDVLVTKHTTLEVNNIARVLAQPTAKKEKNACNSEDSPIST